MDNREELLKIDGVELVRGVGFCGFCNGKECEDTSKLTNIADMETRQYVCSVDCLKNLREGNTYKEKEWIWTEDDEDFSYAEEFVSKEKAIENALCSKNRENNTIYVGKKVKVEISGIDAEDFLERIAEDVAEEVDWNYGSDMYLADVTQEQQEILEERLYKVFTDWSKEFEYEPSWFLVENIEEIDLSKIEGEKDHV